MPQNKVVANVVQKVRAVTKCHISLKTMVLKFQDRNKEYLQEKGHAGQEGRVGRSWGILVRRRAILRGGAGGRSWPDGENFTGDQHAARTFHTPPDCAFLSTACAREFPAPPPPTESLCLSVVTTPTRTPGLSTAIPYFSVLGHLFVHLCCTSVDYNWAPVAACVPVTLKNCRPTRCKNASF